MVPGSTPVRRNASLSLQMLAGPILAPIVGLAWPGLGKTLQPIGAAFIQAIQMIVIPWRSSGSIRAGQRGGMRFASRRRNVTTCRRHRVVAWPLR
jgi:hypothetical protein